MTKAPGPRADVNQIRASLLAWYDQNRRDLPWRRTRDPYAIWLSEIMLQQTRVAAVVERFEAFLRRFPTVSSLADADEQDVLAMWSGLGYYRRARMLHQGARYVRDRLGSQVPSTSAALRELPGVGGYTAAAVSSIAFGEVAAVVDGNVERVLCRIAGWADDRTALRRRAIERLAGELLDPKRPGDFNQAMMELGATVCLPRGPLCLTCPLSSICRTRGEHRRAARPASITKEAAVALCLRMRNEAKQVLLEQRPASATVMPTMWELPAMREAQIPDEKTTMLVRHAIMQVNYIVRVCEPYDHQIRGLTVAGGERRWVPLEKARNMALTGLTRKILVRARLLSHAAPSPA